MTTMQVPLQENFDQQKPVLRRLNDNELILALKTKVENERLLAVQILDLLRQVQARMLHLKMGYPSLLVFCVQELKYSESTAYRRISALRLSAEVPELKEQLQSGALTYQVVAQVQTFLNQEKKQNRKTYSAAEKKDLVNQVTSKTTRQVEQLLAEKSPGLTKPESSRQISATQRQVVVTVASDLDAKLEKLRSRYSHKNPNPTLAELMEIMADEILQQEDVRQQRAHKRFTAKVTRTSTGIPHSEPTTISTSASVQQLPSLTNQQNAFSADENLRHQADFSNGNNETQSAKTNFATSKSTVLHHSGPSQHTNSRYIPATVRYEVRMRNKGRCCYIDPATGKRCESRHRLEIEHIQPVAHGGSNDISNLRLACRNHNAYFAHRAGLAMRSKNSIVSL